MITENYLACPRAVRFPLKRNARASGDGIGEEKTQEGKTVINVPMAAIERRVENAIPKNAIGYNVPFVKFRFIEGACYDGKNESKRWKLRFQDDPIQRKRP